MKKFLAIVGAVAVVIVIAGAGLAAYVARETRAFNESSKVSVDANLPPIISTWSEEALITRASPQLLKIVNTNPGQFGQLFQKLSQLGAMQSYGGAKGSSRVSYTLGEGKVVVAAYVATAKFQNGDARITVRLVQVANEWQLLYFNVNSPLFLE